MASNGTSFIPIVDLSPFTSGGDLESRQRAAKDLAEKGHINGSVGISGHGVSSDSLKEAFALVKKLFDLPYEDKMKAPHPDAVIPHRGYSGMGREKGAAKTATETDDSAEKDEYLNASDYKESYEVGSEENSVQYNIWLPEEVLPGFRKDATELFWKLNNTANAILDALIMSLDLTEREAESVRALHTGHENQLRFLHYPSISSEMLKNKDIGRLGAHTDWRTQVGGWNLAIGKLAICSSAFPTVSFLSSKHSVSYRYHARTNFHNSLGFYPSALHRVVISGKASGEPTPARYSIPYFVVPLPDGVIEPQPSLVTAHGKQVYEPVTFNSYSEQMFKITQIHDAKE
ncbi:thymine dioxygenase protein [Rutstroemia sp. NJR-2017a BBW]|nr:thymine dioxygenase protein [Rutstroemia sp. NJR-2017a BBW]